MNKLILCALWIIQVASAADFHARIQVFVSADERFATPAALKLIDAKAVPIVKTGLVHQLEAIDGVITVNKEPDFFVSVAMRAMSSEGGRQLILLGTTSSESIPDGFAEIALRGQATRAGIDNMQKLFRGIPI
jgi:hypothetical protein